MKQDDQGKKSSRQDRLKLALRENLKRRKSQARERGYAASSSAGRKASLDDGGKKQEATGETYWHGANNSKVLPGAKTGTAF